MALPERRGAVIVDAGSSGSRVLVYMWDVPAGAAPPTERGDAYPNRDREIIINQKLNYEGKTDGLSKVLAGGVHDYLKNLFHAARLDTIIGNDRQLYSLKVMATGGVRGLEEGERTRIRNEVNTFLHTITIGHANYLNARYGFISTEYEMISGKKEALYGWIASNYLLRHLPRPGLAIRPGLVGYLEMGGATAQIAFEPSTTELHRYHNHARQIYTGDLTRLKIWGQVIDLYLRTFQLGGDKALGLHTTALGMAGGTVAIPTVDVCRPTDWTNPGGTVKGGYNHPRCQDLSYRLLDYLNTPEADRDGAAYPGIAPTPDLLGTYPPINLLEHAPWNPTYGSNSTRQFVGGAHFWYTTRLSFGCDAWGYPKEEPYTFSGLKKEVMEKGGKNWANWDATSRASNHAPKVLFNAAWVTTVLYEGFGFNREDNDIRFQPFGGPTRGERDKRPTLSWALGAAFICAIRHARDQKLFYTVKFNVAEPEVGARQDDLLDPVDAADTWA